MSKIGILLSTFLLILIISFPFSTVLISLGLYVCWLILNWLPVYFGLLFSILQLNNYTDFYSSFSLGLLRKLGLTLLFSFIIQLIYSFFLRISMEISLANIDQTMIEWFANVNLKEIINFPDATYFLFIDWLQVRAVPTIGVFSIPIILSFVAYCVIIVTLFIAAK